MRVVCKKANGGTPTLLDEHCCNRFPSATTWPEHLGWRMDFREEVGYLLVESTILACRTSHVQIVDDRVAATSLPLLIDRRRW